MAKRFTDWFEGVFARRESALSPEQAEASAAARAAIGDDNLDSFRSVEVPFLVVIAEASGQHMPAEWEPLMTAYRAGLWRDLGALARSQPSLVLQGMNASHSMIVEAPQETAELVSRFLATTTKPA